MVSATSEPRKSHVRDSVESEAAVVLVAVADPSGENLPLVASAPRPHTRMTDHLVGDHRVGLHILVAVLGNVVHVEGEVGEDEVLELVHNVFHGVRIG